MKRKRYDMVKIFVEKGDVITSEKGFFIPMDSLGRCRLAHSLKHVGDGRLKVVGKDWEYTDHERAELCISSLCG